MRPEKDVASLSSVLVSSNHAKSNENADPCIAPSKVQKTNGDIKSFLDWHRTNKMMMQALNKSQIQLAIQLSYQVF